MGLDEGMIRTSLAKVSSELLQTGAYNLTEDEYSPVIKAIGEAFLGVGRRSIEFHEIDLKKFSEAELTLAETQLENLREEAPQELEGLFNAYKLTVHHELLRRSAPGAGHA
jgi:hypothetical protein